MNARHSPKTPRSTLTAAIWTGGLAIAVVTALMLSWPAAVEAQHPGPGQAAESAFADSKAHFELVAERLELTAEQREALAEPMERAFAALLELHRAHDEIAEELTTEQREVLAEMIHEAMVGAMHHDDEGSDPHGDSGPRGDGHR